MSNSTGAAAAARSGLFTPKLVTVLAEGYGARELRADVAAGLTVAVVALPLSMAIAVASGLTPSHGLAAAIVGGLLVSALGGSRFQIGGPAGAFIVLVAATVEAHGVDGLLLATLMSGAIMAAMGWLRLGVYVKYIPYPVTVGFTAGIAAIILASQLRPFFGLDLDGAEPGALIEKLPVLWSAAGTFSAAAAAVGAGVIAVIAALKRVAPRVPGMLVAVAGAAAATWALDLPVETIGSRFGDGALSPPAFRAPEMSLGLAWSVLPSAVSFALLGAIESLLSAVVADGMTGRRHRSNCELVGQGAANAAAALFGGMCVTGTIARTATNVRAGAHGPVSGIIHAAALLVFTIALAPLMAWIPLAALAGVLAVVAWGMAERHVFAALLRGGRGDATVLLVTFGFTVFRDLAEAIVVGSAIGAAVFIHRISRLTEIETHLPIPMAEEDRPDDAGAPRTGRGDDPDVVVFRIRGAFFFGAASIVDSVLDRIGDARQALVLDLSATPFMDSTGVNAIAAIAAKADSQGARLFVCGADEAARRALAVRGIAPPAVPFRGSQAEAVAAARAWLAARDEG